MIIRLPSRLFSPPARPAAALALLLPLLPAPPLAAQEQVEIRVDLNARSGPFKPVWAFFGYDEPNYTYMQHGRKLVADLAALSPVPVYFRAHHLLCTGDGKPMLKWGSTNAYTEDASGRPVYDWTIVDRIFDTYVQAGAKPLVEIGFMPEALSVKPQPYTRFWPKPDDGAGWSYPPRDYAKWAELVAEWVRHSIARYGRAEVETWYWELWNEPDISYWRGTPAEYNRLYDYTAAAIKRVLPAARVGGPTSTGPASGKAAAFLRQFLEHCARGTNAVTGQRGAPLDFIAFHAKGSPRVVDGRVRMGLMKHLQDIAQGLEIAASFPEFRSTPIILTESDPEGCAACSARLHPHNAYRNGTMYSSYTAPHLKAVLDLAERHQSNLEGILTWAFTFEEQPFFDGFRELATNGIAKPVLNLFRMAGMMRGARVAAESTGAVPVAEILRAGVLDRPDVNALASRAEAEAAIMVWNYHDEDNLNVPAAQVRVAVRGLPHAASRVLLHHYRIDQDHSNAYTLWKRMGSPERPTPDQYAALDAAGQLQLLGSPRWLAPAGGELEIPLHLPRQAVSLLRLTW
jgi:xylan 1,4-beta-xylosidase